MIFLLNNVSRHIVLFSGFYTKIGENCNPRRKQGRIARFAYETGTSGDNQAKA